MSSIKRFIKIDRAIQKKSYPFIEQITLPVLIFAIFCQKRESPVVEI